MRSVNWIDAGQLRMSSFRYSSIKLNVPQVEKMAAGGHINLNTKIGVDLKDGTLIVLPKIRAVILPSGTEDSEVDDDDVENASIEIAAVVGYELPAGKDPTSEEIDQLNPKQIELFLHMLEPILMLKLKSLLADAGARGVNIPPHVYVPDSAERSED